MTTEKTAKDFVAPLIAAAFQHQTLEYLGTQTGRFLRLPEHLDPPNKRAKVKAARKQRRKQK